MKKWPRWMESGHPVSKSQKKNLNSHVFLTPKFLAFQVTYEKYFYFTLDSIQAG